MIHFEEWDTTLTTPLGDEIIAYRSTEDRWACYIHRDSEYVIVVDRMCDGAVIEWLTRRGYNVPKYVLDDPAAGLEPLVQFLHQEHN